MFFVIWFIELYEVWLLSNEADFIVWLEEIGPFIWVSSFFRRGDLMQLMPCDVPTLRSSGGGGCAQEEMRA